MSSMTTFRGNEATRRLSVALLGWAIVLSADHVFAQAPAGASPFQIVVNAANPATEVTREQLSKMFFKRITRWPSGGDVEPIDLASQDQTREAFTRAVHRKSVPAVRAFWQQQIFSGRDVPPPEKAAEADVIAFVQATQGAVAYVSAKTQLPAGVKAIPVQ